MNAKDYRDYFENIAKLHQQILHHPTNAPRFMQVVQSADPITGMWSSDFTAALRSKVSLLSGKALLVLEHYENTFRENAPNNRMIEGSGAFLILKKPISKSIDDNVQAVADCQVIGEQILAWIENDCRTKWEAGNQHQTLFHQFFGAASFNVTNVQDLWGRRFEFTFLVPRGETLVYSAVPWTPPPPPPAP